MAEPSYYWQLVQNIIGSRQNYRDMNLENTANNVVRANKT